MPEERMRKHLREPNYCIGYLRGVIEATSWQIKAGLTPESDAQLYELLQKVLSEVEDAREGGDDA